MSVSILPAIAFLAAAAASAPLVERDVAVPMRDGVVLRADVWRPAAGGRFPVLVYRTPYDRRRAQGEGSTVARAAERGYAVVVQDVRGRYGSGGEFDPYRHEGRDGYDTIEWAAAQDWSDGSVGTFGLSYPGAVQWLAAVESPPHLEAMAPAMTFSTPRNFFYSGGVFDMSWTDWIWCNIAPDERLRRGLAGPRTVEEARAAWARIRDPILRRLPLSALDEFRDVAPYLFTWLEHPAGDPWWDWAELRGRYGRVGAAVLNLSGWHDEAYGPEGALTNFLGLLAERRGQPFQRLIRQAADIRQAPCAGKGRWFLKLTSSADEAKDNLGMIRQTTCRFQERVQRMAGAVVAGIHHDVFLGQSMFRSKLEPALVVVLNSVIMRPGRNHEQTGFRDAFAQEALLHESIEDDNCIRRSKTEPEHRLERLQGHRSGPQPSRRHRFIRIEVQDP